MSAPAVRLHRTAPDCLRAVDVVLVGTSHPGNVGACARAMRVMGLRSLALVAPRLPDVHRHPEARAFASGATDVLDAVRYHPTLQQALAEVTLAVAVSADVREFGPPPETPEVACAQAIVHLRQQAGGRVALVFGAERTGLSIADVQRCQRLCSIPGDPDYNSLNLAQAVQVMCFVMRRAAEVPAPAQGEAARDAAVVPGAIGSAASAAELDGFFAHLERALVAIGYLDPALPRKLMARMRRLFARGGLEREEVNLLRGVFTAMEDSAARAAGKPPAER